MTEPLRHWRSTELCLRTSTSRLFPVLHGGYDAVIILGSVIRGETPHFDYICQGVTYGIARLITTSEIPIIYGLLTTNDRQQALDRCGGKYGNMGDECAIDAIKMAKF